MPLDPVIQRMIRNVFTHMCTAVLVEHGPESTAARPAFVPLAPRRCVAIVKTPACRAAEAEVNRLALLGDPLATNRACNAWVQTVKTALAEERAL